LIICGSRHTSASAERIDAESFTFLLSRWALANSFCVALIKRKKTGSYYIDMMSAEMPFA
jgi:hypothetical protein